MSDKVVVTQAERDGCHARWSSSRLNEMGVRQGGRHAGSDDLWNSAKTFPATLQPKTTPELTVVTPSKGSNMKAFRKIVTSVVD